MPHDFKYPMTTISSTFPAYEGEQNLGIAEAPSRYGLQVMCQIVYTNTMHKGT